MAENPSYRQVLTGKTGQAESIKVSYNPNQISFSKLVEVFFASHDPTTLNKQGPDIGPHYRSIAFYENNEEKIIIETMMCFKRAGCDAIITYFAPFVAKKLVNKTF